jgi:hypothetical protein
VGARAAPSPYRSFSVTLVLWIMLPAVPVIVIE